MYEVPCGSTFCSSRLAARGYFSLRCFAKMELIYFTFEESTYRIEDWKQLKNVDGRRSLSKDKEFT